MKQKGAAEILVILALLSAILGLIAAAVEP